MLVGGWLLLKQGQLEETQAPAPAERREFREDAFMGCGRLDRYEVPVGHSFKVLDDPLTFAIPPVAKGSYDIYSLSAVT
jgi:hypothetical protein